MIYSNSQVYQGGWFNNKRHTDKDKDTDVGILFNSSKTIQQG